MKRLPLMILIVIIIAVVIAGIIFIRTNVITRQAQEQKTNTQSTSTVTKHTITILNNGFNPQKIEIKKGDTVIWINDSGEDATVNSDPYPVNNLHRFLNLGGFPDGSSVQAVFNEVGNFTYHNHFKPEQKGTVVVE